MQLGFCGMHIFSLARPLPLQRLPGSQQHGGKKLTSPLGRPPKPQSDTPTHPAPPRPTCTSAAPRAPQTSQERHQDEWKGTQSQQRTRRDPSERQSGESSRTAAAAHLHADLTLKCALRQSPRNFTKPANAEIRKKPRDSSRRGHRSIGRMSMGMLRCTWRPTMATRRL